MKKFVALLLAVSLVLVSFCALAATGSKDGQNSKQSSTSSSSSSGSGSRSQGKKTEITTEPLSDGAKDLIESMEKAVQEGDSAVSTLPEDIAAQLGDDAVASEATGIEADGTSPVDAEFTFPTQYDVNTKLFALITCYDADKTVTDQFVLPASPLPNGKVKVHFTREVLDAMKKADSTSIIIFEKKV